MAQTEALIRTLKAELKAAGVTYAQVARALDLSEASVKRLFAEGHFSLIRLEAVLALIGLELSDLVERMQKRRQQVERLTPEQEQEIADDIQLLLVAVSVINGFTFEELASFYRLGAPTLTQKLATLDRLRLIDLLPGNRIKLKIAPNFRWLPNGPIQRFFLQKVQVDFFNSSFDADNEKLLVLNCLCSETTNRAIQQRLQTLVDDITALANKDKNLPLADRHGNTLVLALRQWQYGVFRGLVRNAPQK